MSVRLTSAQLDAYERDGFVVMRELFQVAEVTPLLEAYREDPTVRGALYGLLDKAGAPHPICIWTELADDVIGMMPRIERLVDNTELLLGEPCYHWHSKLTVKPPRNRAHITWHQDYTSWYDDGVMFPQLLTVGIAIEPATRHNGCLQLVPGSHRLGRLSFGEDFDFRVEKAKETLGVVDCELDTGDAVFFHCNTLHGSTSNETDTSRLMLLASYNASSNQPFADARGDNQRGAFMNIAFEERRFKPLEKVSDTVLLDHEYLSVFDHTRFKTPITSLDDGFLQVAKLS